MAAIGDSVAMAQHQAQTVVVVAVKDKYSRSVSLFLYNTSLYG
jgi:hypothetical protein